jgi:mRNA-degrading endonuclease RelE of RelBE toxin-antitoxin system
VRLTAAPGYAVDLYGFDLAGFGVDYVIAGLSVFAGATTLFSEANVLVQGDLSGPRHTTFAFTTPLSAPELLLQVDLSNLASGIQDNVAMDSIRFGQTPPPAVPEPAPALLLAGLALTAVTPVAWRPRRSSPPNKALQRSHKAVRAHRDILAIIARMPFNHPRPEALEDLNGLRPTCAQPCATALRHIFGTSQRASRSRIKRLKKMSQPQYRLRLGDIRVFYDVTEEQVEILAIVLKSEATEWLAKHGKSERGSK